MYKRGGVITEIATIITVCNHSHSFKVSCFEKSSNLLIKECKASLKEDHTVNDLYFKAIIRTLKEAKSLSGDIMIIGMAYQVGVNQLEGKYTINKRKHKKMINEIKQLVKTAPMKIKFKHIKINTLKKLLKKYIPQ